MKINNVLLGILFVFSLVYGKNRFGNYFSFWHLAFIIQGFFLLKLVGLLYSEDLVIGLKKIETALSFLIIPYIFLSRPKIVLINQHYIYYSLICGTTIAIIICGIGSFFSEDIIDSYNSLTVSKYTYSEIIRPLDGHPTYMSLLMGASIVLLVKLFTKRLIDFRLYYFLLLVHIVFLFLLTSRTVIIYYVFVGIGYLLFKRRAKTFFIVAFAVSGLVIFGLQNEYTKKRIYEPFELTENPRVERLKIHFDIFKEAPFIGHGTGSTNAIRKEKYKELGREYDAIVNYNAHNQILEYLTSNGLLGGIFYLVSFISLFLVCYKIKEFYLLVILGSVFFSGMTESNLERYMGIEFYSLFSSLALVIYINKIYFNEEQKNFS